MKQYLKLLKEIKEKGVEKTDRTGVGTLSIFGPQLRFDLSKGFPAVTTKSLSFAAVKSELLWFIEGSGDERRLADIHYGSRDWSFRTIWSDNAEAPYWTPKARFKGDLGRVYGVQWRDWRSFDGVTVDQLHNLIQRLRSKPDDRRHILSAWNPGELDLMALPPCHCFAQFYVAENKLSCMLYQRSYDAFLGGPFNHASYALLTHMLAQVCNYQVGELIHNIGDAHIYKNHLDQVDLQLTRKPMKLPKLWLNPDITDITKFGMNDIRLEDYKHHPTIRASMAV